MPDISLVVVTSISTIHLVVSPVAIMPNHIHTYVHDQQVAAAVWNVNHHMGKFPSVIIVDTGNSVVIGDIVYVDLNHLTLTFSSSFSGKVYMN